MRRLAAHGAARVPGGQAGGGGGGGGRRQRQRSCTRQRCVLCQDVWWCWGRRPAGAAAVGAAVGAAEAAAAGAAGVARSRWLHGQLRGAWLRSRQCWCEVQLSWVHRCHSSQGELVSAWCLLVQGQCSGLDHAACCCCRRCDGGVQGCIGMLDALVDVVSWCVALYEGL